MALCIYWPRGSTKTKALHPAILHPSSSHDLIKVHSTTGTCTSQAELSMHLWGSDSTSCSKHPADAASLVHVYAWNALQTLGAPPQP